MITMVDNRNGFESTSCLPMGLFSLGSRLLGLMQTYRSSIDGDEYQLRPMGILTAPLLERKDSAPAPPLTPNR